MRFLDRQTRQWAGMRQATVVRLKATSHVLPSTARNAPKAQNVLIGFTKSPKWAPRMQSKDRSYVQPMQKSYRRHTVLFVLIALIVGVEVSLWGADLGLWGARLWRSYAYLLGAFRPSMLTASATFWEGQRYGMFLTHIFVHVGPFHMITNAIALALLGHYALERLRQRAVVLVFFVSAIGGALMFTLLPGTSGVMTGASGALCGLGAAWGVQSLMSGYTPPRSLAMVLGVIALSTLLELGLQDHLAWQAHFGGSVTGAILGLLLYRRP